MKYFPLLLLFAILLTHCQSPPPTEKTETNPSAESTEASPSASTQTASQSALNPADYPAPAYVRSANGGASWKDWTYTDRFHGVARANDPFSPRHVKAEYKSSQVDDFQAAMDRIVMENGVKEFQHEGLEKIEYIENMGAEMYITLGRSKMAEEKAVCFLSISKNEGDDTYQTSLVEVPEVVYKSWGGITSMIAGSGLVRSVEDIPEAQRTAMANASHKQQIAFFEGAFTSVMTALTSGGQMTEEKMKAILEELQAEIISGSE